jgi:hypothetical protein
MSPGDQPTASGWTGHGSPRPAFRPPDGGLQREQRTLPSSEFSMIRPLASPRSAGSEQSTHAGALQIAQSSSADWAR